MKQYLSFLFLILAVLSCDNSNKVINERIAGSDSAAINYFRGNGNMDTVIAVKIIRDKKQLEQLAGFISSSSTEDYKCGYDGSIHFFKNNMVLQDIDFRMNDANCMHFNLLLGGKLYSMRLSAEAKQFLEGMKK